MISKTFIQLTSICVVQKLVKSQSQLSDSYQPTEVCDGSNSDDPGTSTATATFAVENVSFNSTIEKVFCAYGISEQVADVFDHGCWCGAPFGSDVFHGKPVDEADYRAFFRLKQDTLNHFFLKNSRKPGK